MDKQTLKALTRALFDEASAATATRPLIHVALAASEAVILGVIDSGRADGAILRALGLNPEEIQK